MERQAAAELALVRRLLKDADGRVSRCAVRVARQQAIVEGLRRADRCVAHARSILEEYEKSLQQCRMHRELLRTELKTLRERLLLPARRQGS
jgi:hypothetical protein